MHARGKKKTVSRRPPRQNRVTPLGELIATPARGTLMGNRGRLHDAKGHLTRRGWTTLAWICCLLEFKGRRRRIMTPGRYTELFFLDEATAFSAGHRPCGECRRSASSVFKFLWFRSNAHLVAEMDFSLGTLDKALHAERIARQERKENWLANLDLLPSGTFVAIDSGNDPWMVFGEALLRWTPQGYRNPRPRPTGVHVRVLTPPSMISVLGAGYPVEIHSSAQRAAARMKKT